MRYLHYTNYQSGCSGLSNAIMSIEIGVVLALLTNRMLLLDGNRTPPANIVDYQGRVDNTTPSRVTDLIDIPVPWAEPDDVDTSGLRAKELTDQHVFGSAFYVPGTVDIESEDARMFARGRETWLCETDELHHVDLLRMSEDPVVLNEARNRTNLGFYSYFFYLDPENRRAAYRTLAEMRAKAPYEELAAKVAGELGGFNGVHMRRGDFKVTYGVTTLDRHPWEAIEALDYHFDRSMPLLICTDERNDPFFDELKAAYTDHVFVDEYILDRHGKAFAELPTHDSIALAYLSQLVTSYSQDFIGTMTSTFTSIIQRYRGNRGRVEPFKFLWNELPEPGDRLVRGRHAASDCVPMEQGVMVPEYEGPYSWNRYSSLINPGWMREWPESILTAEVLETGLLGSSTDASGPALDVVATNRKLVQYDFDGLGVEFRSDVPGMLTRFAETFGIIGSPQVRNIVARYEVSQSQDEGDDQLAITFNGRSFGVAGTVDDVMTAIVDHLVHQLGVGRVNHTWIQGMAFEQGRQAIIVVGDKNSDIADSLCTGGWDLLGDIVVPVRQKTLEIAPFSRYYWPVGGSARHRRETLKLKALVFAHEALHSVDEMVQLSPAVGMARALGVCVDYRVNPDKAMKKLIALVEAIPVFAVNYSDPSRLPNTIGVLAEKDAAQSDQAEA
ncbi:MAG: O-fucosyltransferase family protein [Pseudomonadota bacterium]